MIIKPVNAPRAGWDDAFRAHEKEDDQLSIPDVFEDETFEESVSLDSC